MNNNIFNQDEYTYEINKIQGERFGVIKLYDKNHQLIDIDYTLSKELHTTKESADDTYMKLINMYVRTVLSKDRDKIEALLKMLNTSLILDGQKLW